MTSPRYYPSKYHGRFERFSELHNALAPGDIGMYTPQEPITGVEYHILVVRCPRCTESHFAAINHPNRVGAQWSFDERTLTLTPAVDATALGARCHFNITAGSVEMLNDSTSIVPLMMTAGCRTFVRDDPDGPWRQLGPTLV